MHDCQYPKPIDLVTKQMVLLSFFSVLLVFTSVFGFDSLGLIKSVICLVLSFNLVSKSDETSFKAKLYSLSDSLTSLLDCLIDAVLSPILLDKAETYHNGKLIVTYETMEDTKNHGIEGRDSDALYSLLLSVKDVEAVAFIRQDTPTTCTAGLRSIDRVDVSAVAAKFGGGGHKNASGLSTDGVLDKLIPEIVKEFGKVL